MPINIGVVGTGSHAKRNIFPAIQSCPDLRLTKVWNRSLESVQECAAEFGCEYVNDIENILNDTNIDVVYISTPNGLHFNLAKRFLKSGKHVWCEKTLVTKLEEAYELVTISQEENLMLAESFMFLHHPQFQTIKSIISAGDIGEVRHIELYFGYPHLRSSDIRYSSDLGGGALNDAGCYTIRGMTSILGSDYTGVYRTVYQDDSYGVDTRGCAVVSYPNNCLATLNWGMGLSYRNEITVWGTEGILSGQRIFSKPATYSSVLTIKSTTGTFKEVEIQATNHFVEMLNHFLLGLNDSEVRGALRNEALEQAKLMDKIRNG